MVMAGSLTQPKQSSPKADKAREAIAEALADGQTVGQIAKRLAKGDKKRYHYWYNRITRMVRRDVQMQTKIHEASVGEAWLGLIPATKATVSRASRGRMDAVKFLFAYTGAYNEKVQHEHSGEVQISLAVSRPVRTEDRTKRMEIEEGIVDADVVED